MDLGTEALEQTLTSAGIGSPSGKTYLTRLRAICDVSGALPTPLVLPGDLEGLGTQPVDSNGLANVHKATYQGRAVAVKALKARRMQEPDGTHKVRMPRLHLSLPILTRWVLQRLVKEVIGWAWLRHENILPFVGIAMQSNRFWVVSEWLPNGDIVSFVAQNPGRNLFPLVRWLWFVGSLRGLTLASIANRHSCRAAIPAPERFRSRKFERGNKMRFIRI